jgi:hypothetical protein
MFLLAKVSTDSLIVIFNSFYEDAPVVEGYGGYACANGANSADCHLHQRWSIPSKSRGKHALDAARLGMTGVAEALAENAPFFMR